MIDWIQTRRRAILVAVALVATAAAIRPQVSTALTARGDVLAYAGDPRADGLYRRALRIDPTNAIAVDHLLFRALLSHRRDRLEAALALASAMPYAQARGAGVRMDRALCLQVLGRYRPAMRGFEEVGRDRHDVRALLFAADDARKLGLKGKAGALLRLARRIDPGFAPVRRALAAERVE